MEFDRLREENERLREENALLKSRNGEQVDIPPASYLCHGLESDQVRRYSRQLLVPAFGVKGQENLLRSSVLVIGCGGLGSSAALYLAAGGVGCLGLVDRDTVELNNLHRQIIHTENRIGESKVKSASAACKALNSSLKVVEYLDGFTVQNALDILSKFDVIVDATDNLPTRYLISDASVVSGKPLVSGAALGMDGQITVLNHQNGPCYRCLFPVPPPRNACQRCSDSGVLGVVPGIIGCLEALEAIKIASGVGEPLSSRMLIFDSLSTRFQPVKLRGRSPSCVACGDNPEISASNFHQMNYEEFTGVPMTDQAPVREQIVPLSSSISCLELKTLIDGGRPHVLLDVRDKHQYEISALPNSRNVPLSQLAGKVDEVNKLLDGESEKRPALFVVCRRGIASQESVQLLRNAGIDAIDVRGGLESWTREVDSSFPLY